MEIPFARIHRIVLMSDDALRPPSRSLYIHLDDENSRSLEARREILTFLHNLGREHPSLTDQILHELQSREMEAKREAILYERTHEVPTSEKTTNG